MKTFLILLLVVAAILFLSNPSRADFREYLKTKTQQQVEEKTGRGILGRTLSGIGSSMLSERAEQLTERQNYYVFSTYTIDLDGPDRNEQQWKYLGILKQFVPLQKPAALSK